MGLEVSLCCVVLSGVVTWYVGLVWFWFVLLVGLGVGVVVCGGVVECVFYGLVGGWGV